MVFTGSGPASEALKEYAEKNEIINAEFTGRYNKTDEEEIVLKHQMMNAYLGRDVNSDSLMTNRFYLSALMRKPMIVNEGCHQAEVAEKYGLGIVLQAQDDFEERIESYWKDLDWGSYNNNCNLYLTDVLNDFKTFEQKLISLC